MVIWVKKFYIKQSKNYKVIGLSRKSSSLIKFLDNKFKINYYPIDIDYKEIKTKNLFEKIDLISKKK